jgi:hypothetical protein
VRCKKENEILPPQTGPPCLFCSKRKKHEKKKILPHVLIIFRCDSFQLNQILSVDEFKKNHYIVVIENFAFNAKAVMRLNTRH